MRFNGTDWEDMSPKIDNVIIQGTIRKIVTTNSKTYVISQQRERSAIYSNKLLAYDGENWLEINIFPEDEYVIDLEYDESRKIIWFLTSKNKMYNLDTE